MSAANLPWTRTNEMLGYGSSTKSAPYQVVLLRQPFGDHEVMRFLDARVGRFDMYAEDDYAICIRYCFADPLDAASFRARFGSRERFKLVG